MLRHLRRTIYVRRKWTLYVFRSAVRPLPWVTKRDNTYFGWNLEMLVLESSIMESILLNRFTGQAFGMCPLFFAAWVISSYSSWLISVYNDIVVGFQS